MAKLWDKNYSLDSLMESFTVRNDYILDQDLLIADCVASIAHLSGLNKICIINDNERDDLRRELINIIHLKLDDNFEITKQDEDCHTAIEGYLTKVLGDAGKKIHTGRSRNDQVQTALRLYMRQESTVIAKKTLSFALSLLNFAKMHRKTPMPGRTHMQIAMPSSVGLWAGSFAEELMDEVKLLLRVTDILDQCPLGSAASYGVPIPLDREYTAELMGFKKVQNNVLYANNSRGKFEAILLDALDYIGLTISKISQDLILFSLPEFGYFSLPDELTTGSSIMPQKKNPDGLELARSRSALITSLSFRVKSIIRSLPSGYNRDFQDTKEPLLEGVKAANELVQIMDKMIQNLVVNKENLLKACTPELYATDIVLERVVAGENFRDSYKDVGLNLDKVTSLDPVEAIHKRESVGTSGNLRLESDMEVCEFLIRDTDKKLKRYSDSYAALTGIRDLTL